MATRKMDALERMIHEELPQLLKLTTEEAASAEAASMAQLGTGASPFAVMKVDGKSERTVYQDRGATGSTALRTGLRHLFYPFLAGFKIDLR